MNISKSTKICLVKKDWSRAELAKRLGVTRQTVDNICNGKHCSDRRLADLALTFSMSVSEFIAIGEDASN